MFSRVQPSRLPKFGRGAKLCIDVGKGRHASIIVPGMQQLSDIAKLPLLQRESPTRVREIWLEKFRESSRVVAGTISDQEYEPLSANMHSCPMFLVPVARGSGYMNYVWQARGDQILYQPLDAHQNGSDFIDLSLTFYTDLLRSHKLVLVHGKLSKVPAALTKSEAEQVVRYTRLAYSDPVLFDWVRTFNHNSRDFNYERYMRECRPLERSLS